jgi:predicted ATPase
MSDGTLRVLGLLLAVYQTGPYSVVAVEEPEATVNPAVAEVVVEVLMDASHEKQVLLTSHSPDILDYKDLTDSQIRVVAMDHGRTLVAPVSQAGHAAIQERYTLRGNYFAREN